MAHSWNVVYCGAGEQSLIQFIFVCPLLRDTQPATMFHTSLTAFLWRVSVWRRAFKPIALLILLPKKTIWPSCSNLMSFDIASTFFVNDLRSIDDFNGEWLGTWETPWHMHKLNDFGCTRSILVPIRVIDLSFPCRPWDLNAKPRMGSWQKNIDNVPCTASFVLSFCIFFQFDFNVSESNRAGKQIYIYIYLFW